MQLLITAVKDDRSSPKKKKISDGIESKKHGIIYDISASPLFLPHLYFCLTFDDGSSSLLLQTCLTLKDTSSVQCVPFKTTLSVNERHLYYLCATSLPPPTPSPQQPSPHAVLMQWGNVCRKSSQYNVFRNNLIFLEIKIMENVLISYKSFKVRYKNAVEQVSDDSVFEIRRCFICSMSCQGISWKQF